MDTPSRSPFALFRTAATTLAALVVLGLIVGGSVTLVLKLTKPKTVLPASLASQVAGFKPYFYAQSPAGYTLNSSGSRYASGVLFLRLTKSGAPDIILSEQAMSSQLKASDVLQGTKFTTLAGSSTVNNVEDRILGTTITRDNKVLILANTTNNANSADVTTVLRSLQPAR